MPPGCTRFQTDRRVPNLVAHPTLPVLKRPFRLTSTYRRIIVTFCLFYGVPSWALVQVVVVAKRTLWLCPGKITQDSLAIILPQADGGIPMLTTSVVNILFAPTTL